jgi:hypothetical protein
VLQVQLPAGSCADVRDIRAAVVGHNSLDADPIASIEAQRTLEEPNGGRTLLVGEDLGVG